MGETLVLQGGTHLIISNKRHLHFEAMNHFLKIKLLTEKVKEKNSINKWTLSSMIISNKN